MMNAQDKFELDYWKEVTNKDFSVRYKSIIDLFALKGNLGDVMDWGCGMFNGVLPYIEATSRFGYDPLAKDYINLIGSKRPGVLSDEIPLDNSFDTIITVNAIDHGTSDFNILHTLFDKLKPGGKLYLHVHLRQPNQLNIGHDHSLRIEDYNRVLKTSGFIVKQSKVYETDPLPDENDLNVRAQYNTLVAVLKKPVMIIRNDDVSLDTDPELFNKFCSLCDKYDMKILQAITARGRTKDIHVGWDNEQIINYSGHVSFSLNHKVFDLLLDRNDLIAVHGLYHTHKVTLKEIAVAKMELKALGLIPTYFVPPFNEHTEMDILEDLIYCGKESDRLETYFDNGTMPKTYISYLHNWRFDGNPYNLIQLENIFKKLNENI